MYGRIGGWMATFREKLVEARTSTWQGQTCSDWQTKYRCEVHYQHPATFCQANCQGESPNEHMLIHNREMMEAEKRRGMTI